MTNGINNKYTYVKLPDDTVRPDHVPDVGKVIGIQTLEQMFSESVEDRTGTFILSQFNAERCALIAKEYSKQQLEKLEKWFEEEYSWIPDSMIEVFKEKIKSLK